MKTKSIILLSICAIVTLSFTFVSVKKTAALKEKSSTSQMDAKGPAGGFGSEDKLM